MTRAEYERSTAKEFRATVTEMRTQGYWSAIYPAEESCGWQHFAIPPEVTLEQRQGVLRQFHGLKPKPFGTGGE